MSQSGYTPIQLYYSATAAAVPVNTNLASGELAINITDGKLYYKNNGGTVTLLASSAGSLGDVVGPASATDNALARFDTTTGKLIQNSVGILSDAGILTGLTGITSSGSITFSSLTSGRVTFATTAGLLTDSANLAFDGTNLGLGGTTNTYGSQTALTLSGSNVSRIDFRSNSTFTGSILSYQSVSEGLRLQTESSLPIVFSPNNTEGMRLTTTGLGIKTTTITRLLEIGSGSTLKTAIGQSLICLSANSGNLGYVNEIGFGGSGATNVQSAIGNIVTDATAASNGALYFATRSVTTDTAPSERMRITSAGDVGIGTSSPATRLSVLLAANAPSPTLGTASGGFSLLGSAGLYGIYAGVSDSGNTWIQAMRNNAATAYDLLLQPSGGNLLVGQSTNIYGDAGRGVLEVNGSTNSLISMNIAGVSSNGSYFLNSSTSLSTVVRDARFYTINTNASERFRITSAGDVGIGTTTMTRNFNIGGSGAGVGLSINNTGASGRSYSIFSTNSGASVTGALAFYDDTGGGYRMVISSDGYVGINTTTPSWPLDVAGLANVTTLLIRNNATAVVPSNTTPTFCSPASGTLALSNNGNETFRVTDGNNFLVGSTSVNGSVSNTATVLGGVFRTIYGSLSSPTNTYSTLFTVPAGFSSYIVTVYLNVNDVNNYQSVVVVSTQAGPSTKVNVLVSSGLLAFQMSGYSLQATQNSGATQTIYYQAVRIAQ